jgi:M6 family metalloprotease-like protein
VRPGRTAVILLVAVFGPLVCHGRAGAQDVEAVAEMRGLAVPTGYRERRALDSTAFTLPNGLFRVGPDGVPRPAVRGGSYRMLLVPTLFADSPDPHVSPEDIRRSVFDGPAPRGTLTGAFREFSRGALEVTGTVTPWVRSGVPLADAVGESAGLGQDARLGDHLVQVLERLDPEVDFGRYDNDGPDGIPNSGDDDGWVDAVAFEFVEVAASCAGPGVWPHRWGLSGLTQDGPFLSDDPRGGSDTLRVGVQGYMIQSAVDCGGVEVQDASVIAHEFGHVLGLPDYYHPVDRAAGSWGRRWVLGCWALMAAGSWGCGEHAEERAPFGPTHLSAPSKFRLDWVDYEVVGEALDREYVLRPVRASGRALQVPLDDRRRESLVLEYRTREGFDAELPADGVLVYRKNHGGVLRPDTLSDLPYFLTLLERDGNGGLLRTSVEGGNRGEASDVWGTDGSRGRIHGLTTPDTRRHDGSPSGVTIHSIRVEDGVARVRVSRRAEPAIALPDTALAADPVRLLRATLRVGGGVLPYELEARLPEGVEARLEEDELILEGSVPADVTGSGLVRLELEVVDAAGVRSGPVDLPVRVGPWTPEEDGLLGGLVEAQPVALDREERAYLDFLGNRNGRYDVGDLRAWLRREAHAPGG